MTELSTMTRAYSLITVQPQKMGGGGEGGGVSGGGVGAQELEYVRDQCRFAN